MNDAQSNRSSAAHSGKILVILPTLGDRIETLAETLKSIEQQQRDVELRLVLVSPASATKARAMAKKIGATIVDDPKTGISDAINEGVKAREGEEYYAWMGDDDLFRPGGLLKLRTLLEVNPRAVVSYGGCEYIDPSGKVLWLSNSGKLAQFLLPWGPDLIPHPGAMIRLDALEQVGLFESKLKYAMDLDVFLKLRKLGRFVFTREPVSAFRWHPDSLTVANRKNSSLESEAVKARHLPKIVRPLRFIWVYPIRWASAFAARRINARA